MLIGIAAAVSALLLAAAGCIHLASFMMTGKRQTLREAMEWQSARYDTSFYGSLEKADYIVFGYRGYMLHAQLLRNPNPSGKYVILSHGYTDNRIGSLKYVPLYLDLGYHCILYDLRGHGENEKALTTYGVLEGKDLALLIADTRTRYPDLVELGLHGESLGAASSVTCLRYRLKLDFVVSDCGFSDIESILREGYRNAGMPGFLVGFANVGAILLCRCSLRRMRPIDALEENRVPILFLHGEADTYIPPVHSRRMYERTKGTRAIHLIPGAGHAESILKAPEVYREYVRAFLAER